MPLESIQTTRASVSIEKIYASKGRQKGRSPEPPALEYAGKAGGALQTVVGRGCCLIYDGAGFLNHKRFPLCPDCSVCRLPSCPAKACLHIIYICNPGPASLRTCGALLITIKHTMPMEMKTATAGTMESGDILVQIAPSESEGLSIELQSSVAYQFGDQIKKVITETLEGLGVTRAEVKATDKGALDCTIRARVTAAAVRATGKDVWQD